MLVTALCGRIEARSSGLAVRGMRLGPMTQFPYRTYDAGAHTRQLILNARASFRVYGTRDQAVPLHSAQRLREHFWRDIFDCALQVAGAQDSLRQQV